LPERWQLILAFGTASRFFHRWNGRLFVLAAFTQAITGIYLTVLVRRLIGDTTQHVVSVLGAVLIIFCAVDGTPFCDCKGFHHSSPLGSPPVPRSERLLVHPAGIRPDAGSAGPIGFGFDDVQRPLVTFWSFAQYLLPLGVLELYLWAQEPSGRAAAHGYGWGSVCVDARDGGGDCARHHGVVGPERQSGHGSRKSIAQTLSATIGPAGSRQQRNNIAI